MDFSSVLSGALNSSALVHWILALPLLLILLDVLSGVVAAARAGTFQWQHLADFLKGDALKYLGAFFSLSAFQNFFKWQQDASTVSDTVAVLALSSSIVASIASNIKEWFPHSVVLDAAIDAGAGAIEHDIAALAPPPPSAQPQQLTPPAALVSQPASLSLPQPQFGGN